MAYIQPTSHIHILKGIPLNPSYDDTFTFKDKDTQFNYFINFSKFTLDNYSVVRERNNVLKVAGDIGDYYDVNYMMFQNENFSDKWFYAFITDVQYLNPNTTLITFVLDVMQSWMFDYKILPSLIEREHVKDDSLFKNLENEDIEVQERLPYNVKYYDQYLGSKMLVIGSTENPLDVDYSTVQVPYNPYDNAPNNHVALRLWNYEITEISDSKIIYVLSGNESYFDRVSVKKFIFVVQFNWGTTEKRYYKVQATKREDNLWYYELLEESESPITLTPNVGGVVDGN